MTGVLVFAAAAIVVADVWLLVVCWRRQSVLGGLCGLLGVSVVVFAFASGVTNGIGEGALIISIVVVLIGIVLLALGQTLQRLLDQVPEEGG